VKPALPWILGAVVVVLALLVVFAGLPWLLALLILVGIGLVAAIAVLLTQLRRAQAADAIEQTLATQADADIEKSTPGQLAEMQRLKEELVAAIAQLKQADGAREDALARLPWYMVIGPAGAGKSELIRQSGLEFPLKDASNNPRAVRGVGGTRGFSWWLSHDAVLLDMAGRTLATAAFDDSGDWVAFLETLRRQRPDKPVNGVVVVVAVDQLADQPEARVDSVARAARERLQELVQHLGVVFPVYVVFTRCDRVAGFPEFFEALGQDARREPWGATLSLERARTQAAEALFDEEYRVLLASLSERRMARMAAAGEPVARARAFTFPLQLERVRGPLRRFVRTLFEPVEGSEAPVFRGFYLAAATTSGEPTDRVLQPAVRSLGLSVRPAEGGAAPRPGSWFVRDLFTEVVFPDQGLAVASRGAQGRLRHRDRVLVGAFGIAWLALTAAFTGFSCANMAVVGGAERAARTAQAQVRAEAPIVDNLRALEALRVSAHAVDSLSARRPWWRSWGAWAGGAAAEPAVRLWTDRATEHLVAPALRQMAQDLRAMTDAGTGDPLAYYHLYRAYRLLCEPTRIVPEDGPVLAQQVARSLASRLDVSGAGPDERRAYPGLIARQLAFLARHPQPLAAVASRYYEGAEPDLVARGAERVRGTWDAAPFARALVDQVNLGAKALDFDALVGENALMRGTTAVPGAYTRAGFEQQVRPQLEDMRRLTASDWLLTDVFQGRPPALADEIERLYAAAYSEAWTTFLAGVQYSDSRDMGQAAEMLATLAKGDSPLFQTLRAVRDETQLAVGPETPMGRVPSDFAILKDFFETRGGGADRVTGFLSRFFQKKPGAGGDALARNQSPSAVYQGFLQAAQTEINKVAQPGAPSADIRKLMASGDDTTNPLRQLVAYAQQLQDFYGAAPAAAPTGRLLSAPITGARAVVASRGLNPAMAAAWTAQVLEPFQRALAGKYPFAASREDASLDDFAAAFGPTGYVWSFHQQNLAAFVNEDGSPKPGEEPPVSPALLAFYRQAAAIRQAFFVAGATPAMNFTLRTSSQDIDQGGQLVRRVVFDVGGQRATYSMGPPLEEDMRWPGDDPTAGASLAVVAAAPADPKRKRKKNEPEPLLEVPGRSGSGVWGLFRLLDQASNLADEGSSGRASWTFDAGGSRVRVTLELQGNTVNHPFRRGALRVSLPPAP
jgi:type VI secretion system protein ImpL